MKNSKFLYRDIQLPNYVEYFLISAISTILVIRFILFLTGYPQVGNDTLHIAHMLWGGLIMFIVIIAFLSFLNIKIKSILAILGGIGFGVFFDELGKFITSDNDYFFQPTVAIFYIFFLMIFFLMEVYKERVVLSDEEVRVNTELSKLFDIGQGQQSPWIIKKYASLKYSISELVQKLSTSKTLRYFMISILILEGVSSLALILYPLTTNNHSAGDTSTIFTISFIIKTILIIWGIYKLLRKETRSALVSFKRSYLIQILVLQIFVFYQDQLLGMSSLIVNLLILAVLSAMVSNMDSENEK